MRGGARLYSVRRVYRLLEDDGRREGETYEARVLENLDYFGGEGGRGRDRGGVVVG